MTKINCPWCGTKVENRLDKLTDHIFKAHSDDVKLCSWARAELVKIGKVTEPSEPSKEPEKEELKYRGKPIDRIPPARKEKMKIPEYLKQQLDQENPVASEQPPVNWTRVKIGYIMACTVALIAGLVIGFYWCWWQLG